MITYREVIVPAQLSEFDAKVTLADKLELIERVKEYGRLKMGFIAARDVYENADGNASEYELDELQNQFESAIDAYELCHEELEEYISDLGFQSNLIL